MKKLSMLLVLAFIVMALMSTAALANPGFVGQLPADKSSLSCTACHTSAIPDLNDDGKAFKANGNKWPAAKPAPAAPAQSEPAKSEPAKKEEPKASVPKATAPKTVEFSLFKESGKADTVVAGGITYVSVKSIADLYKAFAEWHGATKHFVLVVKDFEIKGTLNKKDAEVNGQAVTLDQPVIMVKGRLYIPAESFAKAVGAEASVSAGSLEIKPTKYTVIGNAFAKTGKALDTVNTNYADQPNRPGARPNAVCVTCHNATAYEKGIKNSKDMTPEQLAANVQGCTTCHLGPGQGPYARGTAEIAGGWGMSARVTVTGGGKGTFCMDCHNMNGNPDPTNARRAYPHYGPQANILLGNGGMQVEGVRYGTSPHAANPNSCVSCHMPKDEYGYASHSFKVADNAKAACGSCHEGLTTANRPALGDYDGDGKVKGIQDEVKGLKALLKAAINTAIDPNGGSFDSSKGAFVYYDANKNQIKPGDISDVIYKATWNYKLIDKDGSYGIHNPAYTIQLLQQSYKELTGKDVPNAQIR